MLRITRKQVAVVGEKTSPLYSGGNRFMKNVIAVGTVMGIKNSVTSSLPHQQDIDVQEMICSVVSVDGGSLVSRKAKQQGHKRPTSSQRDNYQRHKTTAKEQHLKSKKGPKHFVNKKKQKSLPSHTRSKGAKLSHSALAAIACGQINNSAESSRENSEKAKVSLAIPGAIGGGKDDVIYKQLSQPIPINLDEAEAGGSGGCGCCCPCIPCLPSCTSALCVCCPPTPCNILKGALWTVAVTGTVVGAWYLISRYGVCDDVLSDLIQKARTQLDEWKNGQTLTTTTTSTMSPSTDDPNVLSQWANGIVNSGKEKYCAWIGGLDLEQYARQYLGDEGVDLAKNATERLTNTVRRD